jgi:3-dehydroquinate synthase
LKAATHFSMLIELLKKANSKAYVLCDENTYAYCYHEFCEQIGQAIEVIIIKAGEHEKNIKSCEFIWQSLIEKLADKETVLINLGGGVVTDIGGFVAATYKRGIRYVNVPTSLLAMVDAATGGKTGVNFGHFKNMIGVIQPPEEVIIHVPFLKTLPEKHLKNGFAEMLKHALLSEKELLQQCLNFTDWEAQIEEAIILKSLLIKEDIVAQDLQEKGLRKTLNLGHTLGHAIEYAAFENGYEILHGEAVATGIIVAIKLSVKKLNFNATEAAEIIEFIKQHYPTPHWLKKHQESILKAVLQDKKNANQQVKMVLLEAIGKPLYDCICTLDEITAVLNQI